MTEESEVREILASLVSLLKAAVELPVRAIENNVLLMAARRHFRPVLVDIPYCARPASGAPPPPGRRPADIDPEVRDSWPAIPRHVTFEVSGSLIATIECRCDRKVSRFRLYSRSGGYQVLQMLAERGAISATEEYALALRINFYSLPDWTDHEIERGGTFGARFENLRKTEHSPSQDYLLERGEVIKEHQEWMV
jgi:hypothetical protein